MHLRDPLLFPLLGPLVLCLAALAASMDRTRGAVLARRAARLATAITFAIGVLSAAWLAIQGPASSGTLGAWELGLSVRVDALSCTAALLIGFIGIVVTRYSENYLDGDPRQATFIGRLCLTLAAVVTLVLSGNVVQLTLAWVATSLTLHRLLVFYPDRPRARIAARKKFWAARAGDLCLVAALSLLVATLGTGDIAQLAETLRAGDAANHHVLLAGVLLATAALLKSAQFPTHGWLVEVMETPTPVSALLHAGIVNAGGFLALRFADVLVASPGALALLAAVGAATALFGSAAMLTQPAIKTQLAYSTVAQMGFMLFEVGIGAFWMALLHLVAHSAYKAHAFLSAGRAVQLAHPPAVQSPASSARVRLSRLAQVAAPIITAAVGMGLVLAFSEHAALITLTTIVAMGSSMLGARLLTASATLRAVGSALGVVLLYLGLERGAMWLSQAALPPPTAPSALVTGVMVMTLAGFGALAAVQPVLDGRGHPAWLRSIYVHLRHGLYANALFDRIARARALPESAPSALYAKENRV